MTASGSAVLLSTLQVGKDVQYLVGSTNVPNLPIITSANTSAVWTSIVVAGGGRFVPSVASRIKIVVNNGNIAGGQWLAAPNGNYGSVSSNTNPVYVGGLLNIATGTGMQGDFFADMLLESTSIWYNSNNTGGCVACAGWTEL
jgi:hypothetical protein